VGAIAERDDKCNGDMELVEERIRINEHLK
jgi:hypothetical protein